MSPTPELSLQHKFALQAEDDTLKTINVYALFRDSENHIRRTLGQLSELTLLDSAKYSFNFFFYCNDSKDNTVNILQDWCALHGGKLLYEELGAPRFGSVESETRVALLSYYRNKNKLMGVGTPSDYSLVVDSDLIWDNDDFLCLIDFMEDQQHYVMATSNCRQNIPDLIFGESSDSFYDIYPFRDKNYLNGVYFSDSPFLDMQDREDFKNSKPVEVMSAFGGLALVDSYAFDKEKWGTMGDSEHVMLCSALRPYGRIAVVPTSKPRTEIDLATINMENCKKIGEKQKYKILFANQLNKLAQNDKYMFQFQENKK